MQPKTRIIYEMHVRGFTQHISSRVRHPGKFEGIIEKLPYLKKLGVTTLELLPIFEFNPSQNYWGYTPKSFLTVHPPYGDVHQLKTLISLLHQHHFEVILDVVYNHTDGPLPGIHYFTENYSGCGHTVSPNQPESKENILHSLQYFGSTLGVDGFRFDLASVLTRSEKGDPLSKPPLIEAIDKDPALKHCLMIAEPWDCGGLYQVGSFPSNRWAEWNGVFRDAVRRFIKGTPQQEDQFLEVMIGSPHLYGKRTPLHSVNFITAHDGFTLRDLVAYNEKHNEENGENNQDGCSHNDSWNCGVEGETKDPLILELRERQMRNLWVSLFFSLGTVMFPMGDEYGRSLSGNNNPYNLDLPKNYFDWDTLKKREKHVYFLSQLIELRKKEPLFHSIQFTHPHHVVKKEKFVSFVLGPYYLAFNATEKPMEIAFPPHGGGWVRVVDTQLTPGEPFDFAPMAATYLLKEYSVLVAKKRA
ncbi:MAG: hypothetical protein KBC64_00435 [Simkaniaceae bacterium]|nr:hypothetical protein [Simkaniaceae bacterium]